MTGRAIVLLDGTYGSFYLTYVCISGHNVEINRDNVVMDTGKFVIEMVVHVDQPTGLVDLQGGINIFEDSELTLIIDWIYSTMLYFLRDDVDKTCP
jgi:hypothetical protein